jgi:hypothetical protein
MNTYRLLAEIVAVTHLAYVTFVVLGLAVIVVGGILRWSWVRIFWFRAIHLAMILIVVVEAVLGIICPLTTLENHFRRLAGDKANVGSFVGDLAHDVLFIDAPNWVFPVLHCTFGALVVAAFVLAPPRSPFATDRTVTRL